MKQTPATRSPATRRAVPDVDRHLGRVRAGDEVRGAEQVEELLAGQPAAAAHHLVLHHGDVGGRPAEAQVPSLRKRRASSRRTPAAIGGPGGMPESSRKPGRPRRERPIRRPFAQALLGQGLQAGTPGRRPGTRAAEGAGAPRSSLRAGAARFPAAWRRAGSRGGATVSCRLLS